MKSSIITLAAAAGSAYAAAQAPQSAYGQCGGTGFTGPTTCVSGYHCQYQNDWYAQCVPGAASTTKVVASTTAIVAPTFAKATVSSKTSTTSAAGSACSASAPSTLITKTSSKAASSVAAPVSSKAASTTVSKYSSTKAFSTSVVASSSAASVKVTTSSSVSSVKAVVTTSAATTTAATTGKVQYAGVNIAGFDFGCGTDGTCSTSGVTAPGANGNAQMKHFVTDDGLNAFRLPVGWQYLTNNVLGGGLDATNGAAYDALVQGCLTAGAEMCIIDIHNYARWNGQIVGQSSGAVTDADLVAIWIALATKYASNTKVVFGVMNEPHDLDMTTWSTTVQSVVKAIRTAAGSNNHKILLPGTQYTAAGAFLAQSEPTLSKITNNDGSTTNLIFDVHQYLDSDNSGTNSVCDHNNVDADATTGAVGAFPALATWLRSNKRQAMLSETGGSSDSTCLKYVCEELAFLMTNSDVFLGWTGWAAGSFDTSYVLSETPSGSAGAFTDQAIVSQCIAGVYNKA